MNEFATFLSISMLVVATPGQDTALVIKNTLRGGRMGGVFTTLGVVAGQVAWTLAVSAGVAALLLASEPAFVALRLAGAAYLMFLGLQALGDAVRPGRSKHGTNDEQSPRRILPPVAVRQGLLSSLGNPKLGVFFTSLLPQFAPDGNVSFLALLLLGLAFCSLTLGWLMAYAIAVAKAGDALRRAKVRRCLDGLMGSVLIALGLRLATDQR